MASDSSLPAKRPDASVVPAAPTRGLDRRAVERVLARAAELGGQAAGDESDLIGEDRLVEIAKEAGLPVTSVRQAIAEERTRGLVEPENGGWVDRVSGPGVVSASRTIPGDPSTILAMLDEWMQRDECLAVQRRYTERVVWEPRRDFAAKIRIGIGAGGRSYALSRAHSVGATVIAVDDRQSVVRLDADIRGQRTARVRIGGALGGIGVAAGSAVIGLGVVEHALLLGTIVGAAPVAAGTVIGYAVARRHRVVAQRVSIALEQLLDRLEYGAPRKPRLLDALVPFVSLR